MARVLLVDDSESIRKLVRFFLETDPSLEIVGEASNGEEGLTLAAALAPDVIVMDLRMPVMDGVECTRRIKEASPGVEVVAFTSTIEQGQIDAALAAGAYTKVDKDDLQRLLDVLLELSAERVAASSEAAPALVPSLPAPYWEGLRDAAVAVADPAGTMTERWRRWAFGALAFGGAALLAVLLFVLASQPNVLQDPVVPRARVASVPDGDVPRVGMIGSDEVTSEQAKDRAQRKRERTAGGRADTTGSTAPIQVAQAPALATSKGSLSPTPGDSKSRGASSPEPQVAAMPAKHEVPSRAQANYHARPGADKGKAKARAS